ncbi:hypothetical protein ACG04Q_02305 [Roseateles sp. DXS20W]|uniref:Peptidase M48 domain-containing protein n=1 Tax=Pelomonas lactea TaxID=3299030 RepID=A0ABW7GEK1_9BURK
MSRSARVVPAALLALALHAAAHAEEPASFESIHDRVLLAGSIWCPRGFNASADNPSRRCGASVVKGDAVTRKPGGSLMAERVAAAHARGDISADEAAFLVAHRLAHHVLGHEALRMQPGANAATALLGATGTAADLMQLGQRLMFPQPRANTPREFEAQERDADLLAFALLPLAGFRLTAASAALQSTVPEVVQELHLPSELQTPNDRSARARRAASAICRQLLRQKPALPAAEQLQPAYGAAPTELEAWKALQARVDGEHSCADVAP